MITRNVQIIKQLQYPSGLFAAAKNTSTGYNKAWIRDNIYAVLGLEAAGEIESVVKALHALLDILKKHEYKIDWMIKQPEPKHSFRYIHARYDPATGNEINEEWGNKQNDAVGALLFKIGELEKKGVPVIRNEDDRRIIQKLVDYLNAIEYWHDADNGMWEEKEEIHASSVGACVAGLIAVKEIVDIPAGLIEKGLETLNRLLPRESETKETDMALLSLIYPYNIATKEQRELILKNIEEKLVKNKGVNRYLGDEYYNENGDAEWTMGFPWLAIIYKNLRITPKQMFYMRKTIEAMNEKGELPELYFANSARFNQNTPLGWAQSLFIVAMAS